jgi:hypothetical protein
MTQPQKNTALAFAIAAALLSVPLTWMTIQNAQFQVAFGQVFDSSFGGLTINITGLNGHVTLLFKTPIWFIVCVAIAANGLQLMHASKQFAIPRLAVWGTAIYALAAIGLTVLIGMASGKATLGIGSMLGLISAVIPVLCLAVPSQAIAERNPPSDQPVN